MKKRSDPNRFHSEIIIGTKRKNHSLHRFLFIFIGLVIALLFVSNYLYGYYMEFFNQGIITADQAMVMWGSTLIGVSTITMFVGVRYINQLRKLAKKPIKIFGTFKLKPL